MSRPSVSESTHSQSSSRSWNDVTWTSFLLWDIDREFHTAHEAYERWLAKNHRRRSTWECIVSSSKGDALAKSLRLGSQIQKLIRDGQRRFGQKFDKGDATCHAILTAQLSRLQKEICTPLLDSVHSNYLFPIPHDELLRAARGVRRSCLTALQDQFARLSTRTITTYLPPPRFSVEFCPFALRLQKGQRINHRNKIEARKLYPHDRYDDREICPHCHAHISVSAHSGLPQYRHILFQSHVLAATRKRGGDATFACTSCYKNFDDSYMFLEHVFQKEIGSEKSCLRCSTSFGREGMLMEAPALMMKC